MINVTVWNEHNNSHKSGIVKEIYPNGIHQTIKDFLDTDKELNVKTAILEDFEQGLPDEVLNNTDVLIWWGHCQHDLVKDELVDRVVKRVHCGMGIIFLHSAHHSKPFKKLLGTTCSLKWREGNPADREILWVIDHRHPIVKGIGEKVFIPAEEMYGEKFDIPTPDELVMIGWFEGGEVFRSGITYKRGLGKIFYFQPGHESFPIFKQKEIQQIISNAIYWAKPNGKVDDEIYVCENIAQHTIKQLNKL